MLQVTPPEGSDSGGVSGRHTRPSCQGRVRGTRVVCAGARATLPRRRFCLCEYPPPKRQIDGSGVAKPVIGSHHQPLGRSLTVVPRPWSFPATLSPSPFVAL